MLELEPFRFSLSVAGRPATKGSMKCLGARTKGGRHILVEDHATAAPWRARMTNSIVRDVRSALAAPWVPFSGGLSVTADFRYDRTGPTAQLLLWPMVEGGENANGDLDKLLRNLLDSLQGSGLIKNDAHVVDIHSKKRWSTAARPAGVHFIVKEAEEDD